MPERPGGSLAKRPLQFIWIADCSGSMQGKKIETLNHAIRDSIKPMQDVAEQQPNAQVLVRAIRFSNGAQWHLTEPTDVHDFKWVDLDADGETDMGKALSMVAEALRVENMPPRGLPPVLVLITDGMPTGTDPDFKRGLKALLEQPWGAKAVRIGVAIGEDADLGVLQMFIGNPEVQPLVAHNVQDLVRKIKWASTVPLKAASSPATRTSQTSGNGSGVQIPAPPTNSGATSPNDVF